MNFSPPIPADGRILFFGRERSARSNFRGRLRSERESGSRAYPLANRPERQ